MDPSILSHAPASSPSLSLPLVVSLSSFSLYRVDPVPLYKPFASSATSRHHTSSVLLLLGKSTTRAITLRRFCLSLSLSLMEDPNSRKRVRDDPEESSFDSLEAKRLRDDLLDFLDDTDLAPSSQDLDSVMKSLQEEISATSSPVPVVDLTSDCGESQPQIGYLLEASDDELGLPPPGTPSNPEAKDEGFGSELVRVSSDSSGMGEVWDFDDHIASYDSFEFGDGVSYNGNSEYMAFDGLFDHSDVYYDSVEWAESWRNDSLPTQ